jgi:hypothetical protein
MWLLDDFKNMYNKVQSEKETLKDSIFWIEYNNIRVGGAVISPKKLSGCFLIPPFENRYIVFNLSGCNSSQLAAPLVNS